MLGAGFVPVVSQILSAPGSVDGRTYSNWAFYLNDNTGGVNIFATSASLAGLGYTPHVGDGLDLKGTYTPFDGFPEIATLTQATVSYGTGNAVPGPVTGYNIGGLLNDYANFAQTSGSTTILPNDIASQMVTLSNVWMTTSGTATPQTSFGTANSNSGANGAVQLNDSSGSLAFFYWPSSYSGELSNLYGQPIAYGPSNLYNMTGFLDYFSGTGMEFSPFAVTPVNPVPEPGTLALLGSGTALALAAYVRRKCRRSTLRAAQIGHRLRRVTHG